jgi:drug/metabolite transporter (DMT)-like permease
MNIINARLFFGTRAGRPVIAGSILGIAGIAVLFLPGTGQFVAGNSTVYGATLAISGALVASLGNMVSQAAQKRGLPVIQSNAWGMCYGALFSGIAVLLQGGAFTFEFSAGYIVSLGYLSVFGSIVGFGSYLTLLGRIGAGKAGYAMVAFPVVAIIVSLLAGETEPDLALAIGVGLVITGNIFVLRKPAVSKLPQSGTAAPCPGDYVLQKAGQTGAR